MDADQLNRFRILLLAVLLLIVVGGATDLTMDRPESWLSFHVLFEASLIGGALILALVLWVGWWRAEKAAGELRSTLQEQRAERDAWRRSARRALDGLGEAIHHQFLEWGLSEAEEEVALLLMKGHSHKSIAKQTARSPQTTRQHASAVYRKSGLAGRAELAAFFLEDLMLPGSDGEASEVSEG
jgi:DNA-binding CsgD family transcriptional regulator